MTVRNLIITMMAVTLVASAAWSLNPDDELWIPAAARGEGSADSFWMTDLYLMNLSEDEVTVEITWLARGQDNSDADGVELDLDGFETLVLDDVILSVFGEQTATGGIHIEIEDEDADDGDDDEKLDEEDEEMLVAHARIYNIDSGETFGQGFEGLISDAAISAEDEEDAEPTHVVGLSDNAAFRANWYGLNITLEEDEEDEEEPVEAQVMVELLDRSGQVLAGQTYTLPPLAPVLYPVSELGAGAVDGVSLRFTMVEGEGLFGASMIDMKSNDPTTLEAHWECDEDEGDDVFTDEFFIDQCTFATTGQNPFWNLTPGVELVLEGEEDGEEIEAIVTVLDETETVDGVECRVVEERESEGGELVEVSRNFWALCVETGNIFYFGEDVDDYEDGVIVGHEGAWRAGEDGAEPGVILPGTWFVGARYYQEIAPGVALDRAEHGEMGLTIETEAGTFDGCAAVIDSNELDPGSEDLKIYCPGIGLVIDEDLELTEYTMP